MRALLCVAIVAVTAGCTAGVDPMYSETPGYAPDVSPDDFVAGIHHPFLPYVAGATWTFHVAAEEGEMATADGDYVERIEVRVRPEGRMVNGVHATVVQDTVYDAQGNVLEDTLDWFAEDRAGNVWYLGEETCAFDGGRCADRAGSFEWGVDGALPGIVMHADPRPGQPYYQEYSVSQAMDRARVLDRGASVVTPLGAFNDTVTTEEWNPLEPGNVEIVHYQRGIGPVIKGVYRGEEGGWEEAETLVSYDVPGWGSGGA